MVGCLVARRDEPLRIGKVTGGDAGCASVEWFRSVAERETSQEPTADLVRVGLEPQTRCYVTDEYATQWRMGRVMGVSGCRDGTGIEYQVDFPNRTADYIGEARVYVRLHGAAADPVDTLVCRAHETPYFHERRTALVRSLINQRAASAGLSGLLSASIHLYKHQVEAVRAVLQDPVQRYLLADEVGLGKTIEAGIILRQTLIDDPDASALVLVPSTLVAQWCSELAAKLLLPLGPRNITVGAYEQAAALSDAKYDIVVIDEAHNIAAGLRRGDGAALFGDISALSRSSPRLLLLSATPALHNEQDFLAMLHLLDPSTYALDDVDRFRQMVATRQPIGQFLLAFREGTPRIRIRRMLPRVRELFANDRLIQRHCDELQECCQQEEYQAESADQLIRAIRVTVCETYRIHRRMIRTSRARLAEDVLRTRAQDERHVPVVEEYNWDDRYEAVHDALEEWRLAAVGYLLSLEERERSRLEERLGLVLQALAECSATWLPILRAGIASRLAAGAPADASARLLGPALLETLCSVPLFPGEDQALRSMQYAADRECEGGDQIDTLVQSIELSRHCGVSRCAVFTSYTAVAAEILRRLVDTFGEEQVLPHLGTGSPEDLRRSIARLRAQTGPVCLVCDRSGEEGLNLQSVELLLHFDLPWDPNRLEQRIGRLDRIGRETEVRARVFLGYEGDDSLHEGWYRVLRDGFRIFSTSLSDLQFFVDSAMPAIRKTALYEGSAGMLRSIAGLQDGIVKERQALSEQSALDEIAAFDRAQSDIFDDLAACEEREVAHRAAFEGWVVGTLNFRRMPGPLVRYEADDRTLLPRSVSHALESPQGYYGTFLRSTAYSREGVALFRIGERTVDRFGSQVEADDRGQAFMLWRYVPKWGDLDERLFFRLDFIVQADIAPAERVLEGLGWPASSIQALRRKMDAWLKPEHRTLFVDQELQLVSEPVVVSLLSRSYTDGKAAGTDYNLRPSREWAFEQVVSREHWPELCRSVRAHAVACIEQDPAFEHRCSSSAALATEEMRMRFEQLRRGIGFRLTGVASAGIESAEANVAEEERVYGALIAGIARPLTTIDAVGAIVLSGRNPYRNEPGQS